ncbi:unnamed protein product [Rhizophagus irregularis]|uniref:Uncharacterized protein n=1 Tax=Rhizophagus irregularis TaxID=588596 RepID=A0A2I1FV29_9GLOM|nr:hypothetical protein RhiirA4_451200 [Rhizophagus irregularis]CAB4408045.1 unnamed protein product [Rhizophagus irregularis]
MDEYLKYFEKSPKYWSLEDFDSWSLNNIERPTGFILGEGNFSWPLWFALDEEGFLLAVSWISGLPWYSPGRYWLTLGEVSIPGRYWLALGEGEFFLAVKMNQLWKTPNVLKRNNEHESEEKNIKNEERILALEERRLNLREWAAKIRLLELHNIQFENVFSS